MRTVRNEINAPIKRHDQITYSRESNKFTSRIQVAEVKTNRTNRMSTLGQHLNANELKDVLTHIFRRNDKISETGLRGTPIMLWGNHGLGKTHIIMDFAKKNKWKMAYCAPAQFEEMGDLHGMPSIVDPDNKISGDEYTVYSPPEWVPKEEGPGILLLDDINRADDRILRGVMQLLQNFELQSWKLPPKWQIVATANPDDGNYSVTPMDDAMLTRMLHVTLQFDPKAWAGWAETAGIDKRCINFVLTYPEVITGRRTTPRSLVQFFEQIAEIQDFRTELALITILGKSALDDVTVSSFISFINDDLVMLINPEEIVNSKNFTEIKRRVETLSAGKNGVKRIDRVNTISSRLYFYLTIEKINFTAENKENLINFMLLESIPNEIKMTLYMDLMKEENAEMKNVLNDKRLAKLLLSSL